MYPLIPRYIHVYSYYSIVCSNQRPIKMFSIGLDPDTLYQKMLNINKLLNNVTHTWKINVSNYLYLFDGTFPDPTNLCQILISCLTLSGFVVHLGWRKGSYCKSLYPIPLHVIVRWSLYSKEFSVRFILYERY